MLPLNEIYTNSIKDENDALERIASPLTDPIQIESDKGMLWYYNSLQALGKFFIDKDVASCKQCFYRCGRIDEYLIKMFDKRLLDTGMANITYTLLSDNLELIIRYAHLGHSEYAWMVEHGHSTLAYAVQQSIIENWEKVQWSLDIMARKNQKLNKVLAPDRLYLEALMDMNKGKIEEALLLLLKDHKKRNKHMGIAQDYISIPALGYAKLAWLKGIEVEIDHPLIPKELLPFKPLDHYEDKYDFLKV